MTAILSDVLALKEKKSDVSGDSIVDEKLAIDDSELEVAHGDKPLVDLKAAALSDNIGDLYDNVRAIDLGADGKERPIGKSFIVCR